MGKPVIGVLAVLIGLGAFAATTMFRPGRKVEAQASAGAPAPLEPDAVPPEPADAKPTPGPKAVARPEPAPKPAFTLIASFCLDTPAGAKSPPQARELHFDASGKRLAVRSDETATLWDADKGKLLKSYPAPNRLSVVSPDAKTLVRFGQSVGAFEAIDMASGATVGTWRETGERANYFSLGRPGFSPDGKTLSFCNVQNSVGYSVDVSGSGGWWPHKVRGDDARAYFDDVVPLPGGKALVRNISFQRPAASYGKPGPSGLGLFDPATGQMKWLSCLTSAASGGWGAPAAVLTAGGKWVMVNTGEIQVIDWAADRGVWAVGPQGREGFPAATPFADGKSVAVLRRWPEGYYISGPNVGGDATAPAELTIYASGGREAATAPVKRWGLKNDVLAVAVSRDGKRLAVSAGPEVRVLAFDPAGR